MEILFAHIVIQILLAVGQNVMMLTIIYGVYSLPMNGSWALLNYCIAMAETQGMLFGKGKAMFYSFDDKTEVCQHNLLLPATIIRLIN